MSKSKARKQREKLAREGYRNPTENRGMFAGVESYKCMSSRQTKTKKDILFQEKYRNRSFDGKNDGSFFISLNCGRFDFLSEKVL
ncbi:hypothetical protein ACFDTO_23885 [Microbacteriaceae bacterium 4G12]